MNKKPPPRRPEPRRPEPRGAEPRGAEPRRPELRRPEAPAREGAIEIVYGLRAALAVFDARAEEIVRVGYAREVRGEVEALLRWAASRGVACEEMAGKELDRIADSTHHEGLVVAARPRRWLKGGELGDMLASRRGTAVAFDRVRNPYNVGAILRTAAFFGVNAALFGAVAMHPDLSPMAVRVAEGGAERLALSRTTDLADTLARLRARGVRVVGADGAAEVDAMGYGFAGPVVLVVGNEREGMGERVRAQCDAVVAIRGTGKVESLNVAVAAGVLIARMAGGGRGSL